MTLTKTFHTAMILIMLVIACIEKGHCYQWDTRISRNIQAPNVETEQRKALNLNDPLDARVQREVEEIDRGYNLSYPGTPKTGVWWSKNGQTLADPKQGLILNRDDLKGFINDLTQKYKGELAESIVYLAALAHERAHIAQYRYYTEAELRRHPAKVVETQADIIAGTWVGGKIYNPATFSQLTPQYLKAFQRDAAQYIRCANETMKTLARADDHAHGNENQRTQALAMGALLQMGTFFKSQDIHTTELDALLERSNAVVDLHPGEKMMKWSLRKAYRLCGLPFPKSGQTEVTPLAFSLSQLITAPLAFTGVRDKLDEAASDADNRVYTVLPSIPNAKSTELSLNLKNIRLSYIVAELYRGTDYAQAQQAMANWDAQVNATLPEGYTRTTTSKPSRYAQLVIEYTWKSPEHRQIRLRMSQAKPTSYYDLKLWIDESSD